MRDDPIALLERELLDAARRRAVMPEHPETSSHEPRGPWPSALRPARRRSSLGALAAVVLSGLAVAVALGALVTLRSQRAPVKTRPAHAQQIPGRQRLIDILGVLRRPQTSADLRSPVVQRLLRRTPPGLGALGTPDLPLVRRVVTASGLNVVLVPMKPLTAAARASLRRRFPDLPPGFLNRPQRTEEGLYIGDGGGGGCCTVAAVLESQGSMLISGTGPAFAGGSGRTRLTLVVPDGVATVDFILPRQGVPGAPTYRPVETISVPVRENVAVVQVDRTCCEAITPMIWKAADGQVVRRIGDVSGANPAQG